MSEPGAEPQPPAPVALFVRADDGQAVARMREAIRRRVGFTLFTDAMDIRSRRLATAIDAEIGAIAPQTHCPVMLCPAGAPSDEEAQDAVLVLPGAQPDTWQVVRRDGTRTPALGDWDGAVLDELIAAGTPVGPVGGPPIPPLVGLEGVRTIHVTSSHPADHPRITAELAALRRAGADSQLLLLGSHHTRPRRLRAGSRLVLEARRARPDVLHVHNPELLPAALFTQLFTPIRVVYDVHRDLLATVRTRPWIAAPIRRPFARLLRRLELLCAGRLSGVVTATPAMALEFATRGSDAVSVENRPDMVGEVTAIPTSAGDAVVVVGRSPTAPVAELRRALDAAGLATPIHAIDDVTPPVAALATAAVVWILPGESDRTLHLDLTAIAALCTGRPLVVAVDHPLSSHLQTTDAAVVAHDVPAATQAICTLVREPADALALGARGHAVFTGRFAFPREAEKLVALYGRLMGRIQ